MLPLVAARSSAVSETVPPTTFPEFYDQIGECLTYFAFAYEDLQKAGAPQAELSRYEEMTMKLSWLHPSIGDRLSKNEQRKALTERQALRRMKKFESRESMKSAYEARCVALYDNFDKYVAAIEWRLELASGEPYVSLKDKCVTISSEWVTITGRYLGMIGPSVKSVPKGGLKPIDFGSGDRYKIAVAVGSLEFWNTVEIPPPPKAHLELLAMDTAAQARLLAEPLAEYGVTCERPRNPFFRGLDARGIAYWAVACEDGSAFSIWITEEYGVKRHYSCKPIRGYQKPECFEPCSRSSCYTVNEKIQATDEYVPYSTSVHVEKAPAQSCPKEYASFITQNRGQLPNLAPGEVHRLSMSINDQRDCNASDTLGQQILEIYATEKLDMLKLNLASLKMPPMQLDRSSGPPCELLHINANIDQFADLRCRLIGNLDHARQDSSTLAVRGQFANGDPFEAQLEVCTTPDD